MKHLHCTACKFTLPVADAEVATYKANLPMHCGASMVPDGGGLAAEAAAWDASKDGKLPSPGQGSWKDAPEAVPAAKKTEEPKGEKKGFLGFGKSKKKK